MRVAHAQQMEHPPEKSASIHVHEHPSYGHLRDRHLPSKQSPHPFPSLRHTPEPSTGVTCSPLMLFFAVSPQPRRLAARLRMLSLSKFGCVRKPFA